MAKNYQMDLCEGSILKKMILFAVPLMLSSMLQLMFNAADVVVVGRFAGDKSLAAVGANTSLVNLLTNLFIGLSVGANVLLSQKYGKKDYKGMKDTVHTAIFLSIVSGIILAIVGFTFANIFQSLMKTPVKISGLATVYLRVLFLGMPALMIYNFGAAILRSIGDTKRPLYYLMFSGVINVIFNLFFVIVLKLDVAGVALATIISQYISATLVIRCLIKETGPVHLDIKEIGFNKEIFMDIIKIGLPAGFQGILFSISNVVIQSSVNSFDEIVVAGNSAAQNLEGFIFMAMNAFHQSAITFTGQNMGAGRYDRVSKSYLTAEGLVIFTGLTMGTFGYMAGNQLLKIYTTNPVVIAEGMKRMGIIARTYALCGMMDVTVGVLRGMGYAIVPMIVSIVGVCGLRLVWIATVFKIPKYHTVETVFMSYPISWVITFLAQLAFYFIVKRKWKTEKNIVS